MRRTVQSFANSLHCMAKRNSTAHTSCVLHGVKSLFSFTITRLFPQSIYPSMAFSQLKGAFVAFQRWCLGRPVFRHGGRSWIAQMEVHFLLERSFVDVVVVVVIVISAARLLSKQNTVAPRRCHSVLSRDLLHAYDRPRSTNSSTRSFSLLVMFLVL